MDPDLIRAKEELAAGAYTCVICRGSATYHTSERGIRPLLNWLDDGTELSGGCAADKVVGKAAAMLYCLLGVSAVHAGVLSRPARDVLERRGVAVSYENLVDAIENRTQTGLCPMEQATLHLTDPADAPAAIRKKLRELSQQ